MSDCAVLKFEDTCSYQSGIMQQRNCSLARSRAARRSFAVLAAMMLAAGCAPDSYIGARTTTVQNRYYFSSCPELLSAKKANAKEIETLTKQMEKAEQGAGGSVIGAAVYGPTLMQARGVSRILEETLAEKQCKDEAPKP